jgi:hypothetical protein
MRDFLPARHGKWRISFYILELANTLDRGDADITVNGDVHMQVVTQLLHHYNHAFGSRGELYQSEEADVLIAVYPATRKRGWWTYATLELHQTGGTECVFYSYRFTPAMVTHLGHVAGQVARMWREQGRRLGDGDVFLLREPIAEGSCLRWALATPPYFEADGFELFTNGSDVIRMMMLHAISETEAAFVTNEGLDALERRFAETGVNSLDVTRPPVL